MKKVVVIFLVFVLFASSLFASDLGFGYGLSYYGSKDSKLSRQNGFTTFLSYNFYRPWTYVDIYNSIMISFGKYGLHHRGEYGYMNLDGLHDVLMLGLRFQLNSAMAFKVGAGAVFSEQLNPYLNTGEAKVGPSGYLMLDLYGSIFAFKIGCVFGTYTYGCVGKNIYGSSSNRAVWEDWGSYKPNGEFFIWPQASVALHW